MKKILLLFFVVIFLSGCHNPYKMPKDVYINSNENIFEVYNDKVTINDLIKDTNVSILNKNEKIKTTIIGKNKITILYKYNNKKYKYDVYYEIVDTTKPVFLSANTYVEINLNEKINFCENISYADNYDRNPKCKIIGNFDNTTKGEYELKYVIKDKYNNSDEKDLYVKVKDENDIDDYSDDYDDNNNYEDDALYFKDVIKRYKNKDNMIGIDVSYYQQNIDYKKVKKSGCEFVIIRMAVNSDIDKDISLDSFYKKNIKKAKEAGLKVGVYVYTTAINKKMAKNHANYLIKELNNEKLDFPIAFDFENWSDFKNYKISTYDVTNSFLTFKKILNENGYDAMLYSSLNYLNKVWMFNDTYKVWLAHYTDQTTYQGKYVMWQLANNGLIDGIDGYVDVDIYYKE